MPNTKKFLTSSKKRLASGKDLFKQLSMVSKSQLFWKLKEANSSTAFSLLTAVSNWKHKIRDQKLSCGDHQTNSKTTCKFKQNFLWRDIQPGFEIPGVQEECKYNYSHILKIKLQYLTILFPYEILQYIMSRLALS